LLEKIHAPPRTPGARSIKADFKAQSISDAVAVSAAPTLAGLAAIFHSLSILTVDLLCEGFFVRAGIAKGTLFHDSRMVFGEALLQAYRLESQIAVYPRIMVARDVAADLKVMSSRVYRNWLRQSSDGPFFVNCLRVVELEVRKLQYQSSSLDSAVHAKDSRRLSLYAKIAAQIQSQIEEAADAPDHFAKVRWFAEYWNEALSQWNVRGLERIRGVGLDPKPAVWG